MACFVITGKYNCENYTHALHVADYLSKHLPHFVYRPIIKPENEWMIWLDQINSMNNWHQTRSPVIWKEINRLGGKPHLIGGLGEFWEYCYDYYGFLSRMSKEDLAKIMADNLLIALHCPEIKVSTISIIGATNDLMLELLIYELQGCFELKDGEKLEIKLYDQHVDDPDAEDFLLNLTEGMRNAIKHTPLSMYLVATLQEAITKCDLLIVITNYARLPLEDGDSWLERCRNSMVVLAEEINIYAKRNLRVVLNHVGPVCFNASVLIEYCTTIRLANIVAVTTDEGLSLISMMAEKVDEPVENFWCPPVWGFSGIMSYIHLASTHIKSEVYRPYKRGLRINESSNLPKGQIQHEIRFLGSLIRTDDDLYEEIDERKANEVKLLTRQPILPKIRALGSLLRLWYADEISDDIISLGVCSNGSFGFPVGICFSQPVLLNEKRLWQPLSNLPLYPSTTEKISMIALQVENTLKQFGLGERFHCTTSPSMEI